MSELTDLAEAKAKKHKTAQRKRVLVWYLGSPSAQADPYIYEGPASDFKGNAIKVRPIGKEEDGTLTYYPGNPAIHLSLSAVRSFVIEQEYTTFVVRS